MLKLTAGTHRWGVQVPLPKLILPVPNPLSGVNEGRLKHIVNGGESPHLVRSTRHRVKMHNRAATARKAKRMSINSRNSIQSQFFTGSN